MRGSAASDPTIQRRGRKTDGQVKQAAPPAFRAMLGARQQAAHKQRDQREPWQEWLDLQPQTPQHDPQRGIRATTSTWTA